MKTKQLKITEKDFQNTIIDLAHRLGYRCAHFRAAMKKDGTWVTPVAADGQGFPDMVLVNPDRGKVIWAEIKSETGKTTPAQDEWLSMLVKCGQEAYIWRPSDWEEIVKILGG